MTRSPSPSFRFLIFAVLTFVALGGHASYAAGKAQAHVKVKAKRSPASVPKEVSAQELFKRYKPAVVKIIVKQQNIPISIGAGFFVSGDGAMVTNYHVMRSAIGTPGFSVEFLLGDGTTVRDFQVANCGDKRGLDICLLKLKTKPKSFLQPTDARPSPGETIYVIGHPRNLDFSISNGIVSALRKSPTGVDEVQISAAISPGNSGGPIFDSKGALVGVATKYLKDGQNLNFGVVSSEIVDYRAFNTKFYSAAEAAKLIDQRTRKAMKEKADETLKPALTAAVKGKSLTDAKGFKEVQFDFDGDKFGTFIPTMFDNCTKAESTGDSIIHACFGLNETIVFSVQRFSLKDPGLLLKMNGKPLLEPKPLSIVESLIQEGTWKDHESGLSASQRKTFYSVPSVSLCQKLRANGLASAYFSLSPACRFTVKSDTEPEAMSSSVWVEHGKYLYGFNVWMNEAALSEYFYHVPTIAVLAAHAGSGSSSPAVKRVIASDHRSGGPGSYYQIKLPQGLEFLTSNRKKDGSQSDIYGKKKLIGNPEDDYALVIDRVATAFKPVDYEKASQQLMAGMSNSLKLKLKKETVEIETSTLDGLPGRLISGFGTDGKKEVLVLMMLAFGTDETHLIVQVSDSKNPPERFKDFKTLTSSFKRK